MSPFAIVFALVFGGFAAYLLVAYLQGAPVMADAQHVPVDLPELPDPPLLSPLLAAPLLPPTPGPGARVTRTAGQAGGTLVLVELWQAFGWAGANGWTAEQSAQRWPAISAAVLLGVATAQNLLNWWRGRV